MYKEKEKKKEAFAVHFKNHMRNLKMGKEERRKKKL